MAAGRLAQLPARTRAGLAYGAQRGLPFALVNGLVALSFGAVAVQAGYAPVEATAMSAIVFAASAQFAAVSVVAQGGSLGAALIAVAFMNSRFVPMGAAVGPSLHGGRLRRALQGQAVIDASFAMSARADGRFDVPLLIGATLVQYAGWVVGTAVGAAAGGVIDAGALGLDAAYPAFFTVLLLAELRSSPALATAVLGALTALLLVPVAPPGVPILVASAAALLGLRWRAVRPISEKAV